MYSTQVELSTFIDREQQIMSDSLISFQSAYLEQPAWGTLRLLDAGPGYQIKRIEVNPGKSLGSQQHQHLSMHWIVVAGVATVTLGEKRMLLGPHQSWYVPRETVHSLANPGRLPLTLMAVEHSVFGEEQDHLPIDHYRCSA